MSGAFLEHAVERAAVAAGCTETMATAVRFRFVTALANDPTVEIRITEGQRKAWDGEPDLTSEGWFALNWEWHDFTEEITWIRPKATP